MLRVTCPMRGTDPHGSGAWQAPRGGRKHNGIDYAAASGSTVLSLTFGRVTKLGYPYSDDLSYRYVEVTDAHGKRVRYFYVEPAVEEGQEVNLNDPIGHVQSLRGRYPGITEHVHLEIIDEHGEYLNPEDWWSGRA